MITVIGAPSNEQLTELYSLFGPPPVLTTEDVESYNKLRGLLIKWFRPRGLHGGVVDPPVLERNLENSALHPPPERGNRTSLSAKPQIPDPAHEGAKGTEGGLAKEFAEKTGRPVSELSELLNLEAVAINRSWMAMNFWNARQQSLLITKPLSRASTFRSGSNSSSTLQRNERTMCS